MTVRRLPFLARWCSWWLLVALLAGSTGCSSYRLGTGATVDFQTLYLAPVTNDAVVPQAVAVVTRELRQAFVRDGRLQLVASPDEADVILTLNLVSYGRTMTSARPEDTGLARKFDLALQAAATLTDQRDGSVVLDAHPLTATRQAFTTGPEAGRAVNDPGEQLPAEYQTLPLLAQQLADRALHAVLDVW